MSGYKGTCEGCIRYNRILDQMPDIEDIVVDWAMDSFRKAHHARNVDMSRTSHMRQLLHDVITDARLVQLLYDLSIPILARHDPSLYRTNPLSVAPSQVPGLAERVAEFTQGTCLCGCGHKLTNQIRMFKQGHDSRFMAWVVKMERGVMGIDDEAIPEIARRAMVALPKCVCCGMPVIKGVMTASGWMGPYCATGRCSCREREQARISAVNRRRNISKPRLVR